MKSHPMPPKEDIEGKTHGELIAKYGISKSTAVKWKRLHNLSGARSDRKPSPPKEELERLKITDAAIKYNVSIALIQLWREELGIKGKTWIPFYKTLEAIKLQDRRERLRHSMPYLNDAQLARAFNVTRERIRQLRNDLGVDYIFKMNTEEE